MNGGAMAAQHMVALRKAERVRVERARIKRELHALPHDEGRVEAARLIVNPPAELQNMTLFEFLGAIRRVGRTRVKRWLNELRMSESRTIGALTDRQRALVAGVLLTCYHRQPLRGCAACWEREE